MTFIFWGISNHNGNVPRSFRKNESCSFYPCSSIRTCEIAPKLLVCVTRSKGEADSNRKTNAFILNFLLLWYVYILVMSIHRESVNIHSIWINRKSIDGKSKIENEMGNLRLSFDCAKQPNAVQRRNGMPSAVSRKVGCYIFFRFRSFVQWRNVENVVILRTWGRPYIHVETRSKTESRTIQISFSFLFSAKKARFCRRNFSKKNVMLRTSENAGQQFVSFSIFPILNTFLAKHNRFD